ncbi:transferrin receptor protein 2 isoform X2 [Pseudophryne corroboree]|uniref:transferrin receptor protein 2 isoform X2 n=1 Tax=Pseudophryne corroboree TaxID=495146 RepID=UPI003081D630
MEAVRQLFQAAAPQSTYSIHHGVEDEDEAELHVEDPPDVEKRSNTMVSKQWISPQWQKVIIGVTVAAFVAFILGYVTTRRTCSSCDTNGASPSSGDASDLEIFEPMSMDWSELKEIFTKYLKDGERMDSTIRKVARGPHPSGSRENNDLADMILQAFRSYNMDNTWVESHYAELQFPLSTRPNTLKIINADNETVEDIAMDDRDVYCPYSAVGRVQAGLVYVNYGRKEDFQMLTSWNVNASGSLVIVRTGHITFAEKVYNAEAAGALGVLIFPDTFDTAVYGHVHLGTGDPNTPAFPSFNHTQFPPFKSSGLPKIPAQPITRSAAQTLLSKLSGPDCSSEWRGPSFPSYGLGPNLKTPDMKVQLEVTNVPRSVDLHNVFGSITGRFEPEHYIIVGAQRDSWGPGAAKSGVGTAILLELARTMSMMVYNGFQPRRSILFVSWDGGDFGSIGATEWLEGYLSMLHLKAAAYMSLDTPVLGDEKFAAKSSPLFKNLIENIIKQVDNPRRSQETIYAYMKSKFQTEITAPLAADSDAFAFNAFAGVPALEFSFVGDSRTYQYLDTKLDTYDNLNSLVNGRLPAVALSLAEVAGFSLTRLSHDHILPLDLSAYSSVLLNHLVQLKAYQNKLKSRGLTLQWLNSARGDYVRATERLKKAISQSDLHSEKLIQFFNVRIMRVEFYFLSQYVSAISYPYRHILIGRGPHTLQALIDHLNQAKIDDNELRKQIALFTWTLVGAANALSGEVWDVHRGF